MGFKIFPLIGINFHGYGSALYQNKPNTTPPENYIEDSFRIFANSGITCVRVTFYWESWELNRDQCIIDLKGIADAGDKYGIMCIYDNHQWECSSWIGDGIGMPNSVMSQYYPRKICKGNDKLDNEKYYEIKSDFWNRWWNRNIKTVDEKDGWDAQLEYLKSVIRYLDTHKSTFGFEILNEPEVFSFGHYRQIGKYHEYMLKELRKITEKPLLFCWALPHGVIDNPVSQALVRPTTKDNNVIYDGHAYPPSVSRMLYFKSIALMMGNIPLYMGEINSGFTNGTILTQDQVYEYLKLLKRFGSHGWGFWRWSYIVDQKIPAFNMANTINNRIQPGVYFNYLINAIKGI